MTIKESLDSVSKQFENDLKNTNDLDDLYLKYFSKSNGLITKLIKEIPNLSDDKKREFGPKINDLQEEIKHKIKTARKTVKKQVLEKAADSVDLTLPLPPKKSGYVHPTNQVIREMDKFFRYYGYSVYLGPEIETAEYNFRKLNLPENHPAADLQDTLFINADEILLRTHNSSAEARALTELEPPIRIVIPGKVYRNETENKTNTSFFHNYQGVVVDKGITMKNLKHTLERFHKFLFGEDTKLRFRYKYYPEVSPGMGVDLECKFCKGAGCDVCKQRGWIEVLGSGMIHYNTLKMCGIDPEEYTGFAFGMGLDRIVMQKFDIDDIRKLYGGGMAYKN